TEPANDPVVPAGVIFGFNAFADVQSAVNQVAAGGTVVVYGGAYTTPATLNINKALVAIDVSVNPLDSPAAATVALNEALTLTNSVTFLEVGVGSGATAANLTFGSTVNALSAGGASLTVNGTTTQTFAGPVGGTA